MMLRRGYTEPFCEQITRNLNTDWTARRMIGYLSHYKKLPMEELAPGEKPKVSVTLENERGEQKYISVEDEWLVENNLDIGFKWPEEM